MSSNGIDVVYLWCDGSDPLFSDRKKARLIEQGLTWNENNLGSIRYFDNSELKYSLRSVSRYLPWINHIFIVTDGQRPVWLRDNPKLTIVDHREIIPAELLPTFNSVTIEMYLHKIPNLSEKFLFFNDDMFINAPLNPDFFFQNEKPVVRLIRDHDRWQFKTLQDCDLALKDPKISSHRRSLLNAWRLFCSKRGVNDFYILAHTVDGFSKTMIRQVLEEFPELLERNQQPFRTDDDIQRVIFQLEMVKTLNCPLHEIQPLTFGQKHLWWMFRKEIESFEGTESPKTWDRIRRFKPKMFCLNSAVNATEEIKKKSAELLEELFPTPSQFER